MSKFTDRKDRLRRLLQLLCRESALRLSGSATLTSMSSRVGNLISFNVVLKLSSSVFMRQDIPQCRL